MLSEWNFYYKAQQAWHKIITFPIKVSSLSMAFHYYYGQLVSSVRSANMENIYTSVRPFYFLTKALGLFPMSHEGYAEKGILKVKWRDIIYSTAAAFLSIFLLSIVILFEDIDASSSVLLSKLLVIQTTFATAMIVIQNFWQISKHQSIANFLKTLFVFDKNVKTFAVGMGLEIW